MENYAKWKICLKFFLSKVPEFSHVAFELMAKHCSVFFFVGLRFVCEVYEVFSLTYKGTSDV